MDMMRSGKDVLAFVAILCSLFAGMTRAALVGTFTYPVENGLLFYDGETINVSWTSTLSNASLSLYCRYETDSTWNTYESMNSCSTGQLVDNHCHTVNANKLLFTL